MGNKIHSNSRKIEWRILIIATLLSVVMSSLTGCAFIFSKDIGSGDLLDDVELDINSNIKLEETDDSSSEAADPDNTTPESPDSIGTNGTQSNTGSNDNILSRPTDNSGFEINEDDTVSSNETEFTKTVAKTEKSVVEINTETAMYSQWSGQYIVEGAGSGVIISRDTKTSSVYYIVTNNHVIDSAETITVRLYDGTEFPATLIATDEMTDVALLSITVSESTPDLEVAVMANSDNVLYNGQDIYVIGNPLGELGGSVSKGIISKTARNIKIDGIKMELMQIDAAVNPGNSGGALFDMSGTLIGIVNAKYSEEGIEGLGFAIPINTVKHVVLELAEHGYVTGRAGLGFMTVDEAYLSSNGGTVIYPTAVMSGKTVNGTYTDGSGTKQTFSFKDGDVIVMVGNETFNSTAGMLSVLNGYDIGDSVTVVVQRKVYYSWTSYRVTLTLAEYVPDMK